jgi:glycosyltransferase involved in cell wall biosynthesis
VPADLAVVSQDPRFGWGARAQLDAFWKAADALGRDPELLYVTHPALAHEEAGRYAQAVGARGLFARADAVNQLTGGIRLAARARAARSRWVVATTASYGIAAQRSGRPYAAWIGTSLESEWRGRRAWLRRSRRVALATNAPMLRALEKSVLRGARIACATSPATRDALADAARLPAEQIRILPISVDVVRFAPAPDDEWLAGLEQPVLAFVGRGDDPRKNVDLLLDALPLLRRRVPGARVLLVGRPPVGALPPGATSAGYVQSVSEAIRGAALLIVPSWQEGFGLLAAEALASGVPVVSTPCGGTEDLVRRSSGGLVLEGFSTEELAETVSQLLATPTTLAAMRAAGRRYVETEHAPELFAQRLSALFTELDDD